MTHVWANGGVDYCGPFGFSRVWMASMIEVAATERWSEVKKTAPPQLHFSPSMKAAAI
jgi:hypothetical protein